MMNRKPRLRRAGRALLLLPALLASTKAASFGQGKPLPAFVAGDIVLYCRPGTPQADVTALAAKVNAVRVTPLLLTDCYKLTLPPANTNEADTTAAAAALRPDVRVRWVGPDYYRRPSQTTTVMPTSEPNDPRYVSKEMWGLAMINMPQAWALQKGAPNTNVAVIDSGFDPNHEDLRGQYHPGSRNFADEPTAGNAPIDAPAGLDEFQHGVHVSGTIIAKTNNKLGVAGICWTNVQCVAMKASPSANNPTAGLPISAIISSLEYLVKNRATLNVVAVNESYGGPAPADGTNSPELQANTDAVNANIVVVAAAGNDSKDSNGYVPAQAANIVTVAALGRTGKPSYFTNFGKIDIAAPGGDQTAALSDGILSTYKGGYDYLQGTSMASPHVTGVATLLMSVPGMTAARAIQTLKDTANKTGLTTFPDKYYGYGVLDAYAALKKVSFIIQIQSPSGTDATGAFVAANGIDIPVESQKPTIRFSVSNIPLANLVVTVDGTQIPTNKLTVESGDATSTTNPVYVVAFRYPFTGSGQHTLVVSQAPDPTNPTPVSDTRVFNVTPHVIPAGLSMVSIPYFESAADSPTGTARTATDLFGLNTTTQLLRWPTVSGNAVTPNYANASLQPADITATTSPDPALPDARPLGVGYFISSPTAITVTTYGQYYTDKVFRVQLHEGWNMIGDPYPFSVPFNTVLVELPNGSQITAQAATNQQILPFLYRYVQGEYAFETLPGGTLRPWEGNWVFVKPQTSGAVDYTRKALTLVFSPTPTVEGQIGRAGSVASRASAPAPTGSGAIVSGGGSWAVRLVAKTKNLTDSHNYIGMSAKATEGDDATKAPKPPQVTPFVSLGIVRPNSLAGVYAQDLQPIGGAKSWEVAVNTDQPNADVTLSWPDIRNLPRNYRLTLTDKTTGQTVDLRHQSSYQFNSGANAVTRSMTLTARPTSFGGRAIITNVVVNASGSAGGRSAGIFDISYTTSQDVRVEASVLNFGGRVLASIGPTRAAAVGDNRLTWNGRDSQGRPLSSGTYILQLRAITTDGDVTREVRPFLVTGR